MIGDLRRPLSHDDAEALWANLHNRPRDPRWPGCCGLVVVCQYVGCRCPFTEFKARRDHIAAALPRCTVCDGGRGGVRHIPGVHPEYHPFVHPEALR